MLAIMQFMPKTAKTPLSRHLIVETGLALATNDNVDGVSLHKIAQKIGVTPMAIYRHFANKADLQAEMLDQFIANSNVIPAKPLAWHQWLEYTATKMFDALKEQPSWIPLFGQIRLKPGALAVKQSCLETLQQAGFSETQSIQAFYGMLQCVIGAANQHLHIRYSADNDEKMPSAAQQNFDLLHCSLSYFIKGLKSEH